MLSHPETMRVQLKSDDIGFGLSLHGGVSGKRYRPIKIAVIEDGGPAALLVGAHTHTECFCQMMQGRCFFFLDNGGRDLPVTVSASSVFVGCYKSC